MVCITYKQEYLSPLGNITLASDGENLIGLWFEGQKNYGSTLSELCFQKNLKIFEQTKHWLDLYFSGESPDFFPEIKFIGSNFRILVWKILLTIPYGQVVTYGEITQQLQKITGKKVSAQAVGGAVGHNPISILIPCHRVVARDGSLTGYAAGLEKKQWLLFLENEKKNVIDA